MVSVDAPGLGGVDTPTADGGNLVEAALLLFTRTCGYRHESIPAGVRAVTALAAEDGLAVHHTEDPAAFTAASLRDVQVVVWLSTSGDVLDPAQREAFASWLRAGGGFAGIHSATASENGWPEFETIIGAVFDRHPDVTTATVRVEDHGHPSTAGLPAAWTARDEWYDFRRSPRGRVRVLATVDESTYDGGRMGVDHPVCWCTDYGRGRSWYTALGHDAGRFEEPLLLEHLRGGLRSVRPSPGTGSPFSAP